MKIEFIKSLWGFESEDFGEFLARCTATGYAGIESPMPLNYQAIQDNGLVYVAQGFPVTPEDLQRDVEAAAKHGAVLLNVQAGKDFWAFDQACNFLESAIRIIEQAPIPVAFETHRGKLFYSAASTAELLARFPEVQLTADFSHWTCVSESLLTGQDEAVEAAIQRSVYVHARLGHEEGPQVAEPSHSRWASQLKAFEDWWLRIIEASKANGATVLRINPEFGPPNYMPTDGDRPLADLWDVCAWMKDHLSDIFSGGTG